MPFQLTLNDVFMYCHLWEWGSHLGVVGRILGYYATYGRRYVEEVNVLIHLYDYIKVTKSILILEGMYTIFSLNTVQWEYITEPLNK